jgi:hypothetical protein
MHHVLKFALCAKPQRTAIEDNYLSTVSQSAVYFHFQGTGIVHMGAMGPYVGFQCNSGIDNTISNGRRFTYLSDGVHRKPRSGFSHPHFFGL